MSQKGENGPGCPANLALREADDLQAKVSRLGFGIKHLHPHPGPIAAGTFGRGGVPQEQKMLKGHLPRVIYHEVY